MKKTQNTIFPIAIFYIQNRSVLDSADTDVHSPPYSAMQKILTFAKELTISPNSPAANAAKPETVAQDIPSAIRIRKNTFYDAIVRREPWKTKTTTTT